MCWQNVLHFGLGIVCAGTVEHFFTDLRKHKGDLCGEVVYLTPIPVLPGSSLVPGAECGNWGVSVRLPSLLFPTFHRGVLGSIPGRNLYVLCWTQWHWQRFFFPVLQFLPVIVIPPFLHTHTSVTHAIQS
jgi:hypothetical protein